MSWNSLAEIVSTAVDRTRQQTEKHKVEVDVSPDLPLVPVDYFQIEQVFINLISNSTKYSPEGTTISIRAPTCTDENVLQVVVSNQGPQVEPEHLERIFDKFYRVTAADRVTGAGLGLSICKGIIEAHGGRIWAENLDQGICLQFHPAALMGGLSPGEQVQEMVRRMNAQPHILVIDDEAQILRALRTILTAKQFKVSVASRGEEGLALAAAQPPDLVILDLSLPDMDGVEVCARLREWTQVPIIILSVRESERDKVIALDKGADDYLTKPFGIEELLARIRVALRHSAQTLGTQKSQIIDTGPVVIDLATAYGDPRWRRGQADRDRVQAAGLPGSQCRAVCSRTNRSCRMCGTRQMPTGWNICGFISGSCARN